MKIRHRSKVLTSCCTLCHRLSWRKKRIHSQDKIDFTPYNPDIILPPVPFAFFSKLKERLAEWKFTRVQDPSKAVRHFRGQRYSCFGVPICCSDVAEEAGHVCGQWRGLLWRLVEVWWSYVHWFPFDITCACTVLLALVQLVWKNPNNNNNNNKKERKKERKTQTNKKQKVKK